MQVRYRWGSQIHGQQQRAGGGTGQIGHLVNVCDQQNDNSGNVRVYYPGKQEREQHDYH